MDSCSKLTGKALQYPVHQLGSIRKFGTRITAGCERSSHERPPLVVATVNDFSKHRFVKLDKISSLA
nr:hypothetical protein [uncultured bacterium]